MLESDRARLLVDPLFVDHVGRNEQSILSSILLWPPRQFDWTRFPSIDGVLLSHEHEDHFSIPTLAQIDRRVPIWLSGLSSSAARRILDDMGFIVKSATPGQDIVIKDLLVRIFSADHRKAECTDEWDTIAFAASNEARDGAFYTDIDIDTTDDMLAGLEALISGGPTQAECLYCCNNTVGLWTKVRPPPRASAEVPKRQPNAPFVHTPDLVDVMRDGGLVRFVPGQNVRFENRVLQQAARDSIFLVCPPETRWPPPQAYWLGQETEFGDDPFCGRRTLDEEDFAVLETGLQAFAEYLYGRRLFREILSLNPQQLGSRQPTFVWLMMIGDEDALAYKYVPSSCRFDRLQDFGDDEMTRYAGVVACWASDVVGLFRGAYEPRQLSHSFREDWCEGCDAGLFVSAFWQYFHPFRHPDACYAEYQRTLKRMERVPIVAHWRET